ncbi:hypothetical protein Pmani_032308 [Petrolisthes manimaculis]|uniref:Integrase catalytic domain-containing protein n=1 Tax=Petrolisthes manimaculis TaxID=1843537 RepID=A0AAE1NRZ7_9EUCA|nr:hypothetical protein Pmani_032308 [Petrolisthes manimaculis]
MQSEACVDLGRRLLKVRGVNVPLLPMDAGEKGENCVQCKLSGKERLPEGHQNDKSADVGPLPEHLWDLAKRSTSCLTEEQAKKTLKALAQYADVFSRGDMDLGRTALVKHSVNTGNSSPVKQAPRRVAPAKREEMQQAVESMAALGLIERSDSPWSSPVVLVEKKDGTKCFCVDYRALNGVTVKDSYPLPRIDDTLDALIGAEWFSTLDLKSGYHQVEMEEEDKKKTAFTFGQGLWHFNVMPFGLCTSRGNRFICVIMDYFTKWPEAYALPNHEAGTVAEVLVDQFFTRFGVPRELHSDQGREFESRVFHECCELLGIHKTRTTPLRPQSDGMVERFNRTLADELAKYCDESQRDWDIKLPVLLMAYRSGVHEATGYTPACLMLGRELRLPVDLATGRPPDEELPTVTTGYATALQERLDKAGRQVRSNLQLVGQAMRQRYNQRVREARYAVGDRVWLYNPRRKRGLSPKLQSSWEGPYHVQEVMSDVTYRIRRGQNRSRVVHVDRLWRYFGPGHYSWGNGQGGETVESGEDVEEEEETPDEEEVEMWENGAIQVGDSPDPEQRPCRNRRRPGWLADFVVEDEH